MIWQRRSTGLRTAAVALLALAAAGGCTKQRAQVSGKVKFADGRPVTAGTVTLWIDKDSHGSGPIASDGSYTVSDAPVGKVKVIVESPHVQMMMGRGMSQGKAPEGLAGMPTDKLPPGMVGGPKPLDPSQIVPVNAKYADVATTPLEYTVVRGPQEHEIVVEP
jgi:hypothetical protein